MVFDSAASESDRHALARLERDMIGWLTTVTARRPAADVPDLVPVGRRRGPDLRRPAGEAEPNIRTNPRVSLHLNDDGRGGDIVVLEGEARIDDRAAPEDNAAYHAQVRRRDPRPSTTAEEFTTVYNVPLRIRPTRGAAFGP